VRVGTLCIMSTDSAPAKQSKVSMISRREVIAWTATLALGLGVSVVAWRASGRRGPNSVVLYTSSDLPVARTVLAGFQASPDHPVESVTDTEATKTTGLLNRLLRERSDPTCHIWWSNELLATLQLAKAGMLTPFTPAAAQDFGGTWPAAMADPGSLWYGHSLRARVLIYNPATVRVERNNTFAAMIDPANRGKTVMARPQFGTTRSQWASAVAQIGEARSDSMMADLLQNGVRIVDGNSGAAQEVVLGSAWCALTDTDDAIAAIQRNNKLDASLLTFGDSLMPVLIPNTFAMIGPHEHGVRGTALLDYLLSAKAEGFLAQSEGYTTSLRSSAAEPVIEPGIKAVYERLSAHIGEVLPAFTTAGLATAIESTDVVLSRRFPI
jgi:iron(III) transport system substrate-binding protein